MQVELTPELNFKTSRSSGAGGQHVNKVETAVEGSWLIDASQFFDPGQKELLKEKLKHRMNKEGYILVKSQVHRTQLANKQEVIEKFNKLVAGALEKKKARIATQPSKGVKAKRLEAKKIHSNKKQNRSRSSWDF